MNKRTKPSKSQELVHATPAEVAAMNLRAKQRDCDHKFIDSKSCLKCGWTPPAPANPANPVKVASPLSNQAIQEIEDLVNASIHELVFALQHIDQADEECRCLRADESMERETVFEDAQNCLTTVGMNVDRIQEIIAAAMKEVA